MPYSQLHIRRSLVRKQSSYVAVIIAFALVVAACGGGDGGTFLDQSSEDAAGTDAPISIDDLPTDVGDLPGVSGECEALLNLFLSIAGAFLGGSVLPLDPGTLASLPADIRDDAQLMSEVLSQFGDGLQDLGIDFSDPSSFETMTAAQQEAFTALTDLLDSEQFNAASDNLSEYGEQQCESQFEGIG